MSYFENDTQIQFRLPSSLKKVLMKRAKRENVNISALLRQAIYEYLELHPETVVSDEPLDEKNDSLYAFRISKKLKKQYLEVCERQNIVPPENLRRYMDDVVNSYCRAHNLRALFKD